MHAMHDRVTAARVARRERPATAQPAHLRLDPAGLMALQRAVGNAGTGAILARARVLARRPDEAKVRARAYELWERSGGGVRSREEDEANYYEALRQVEIEERAFLIGGQDLVASYYEAERQIAEERKSKPPAEELKPPVEAAKPVIEAAKPKPAYVPPHQREGFKPSAEAKAAPAKLAPGEYEAAQLTKRLGFERKSGNHLQRDVRKWEGFAVHVSVYHDRGTFDELHVKFDLGPEGSAWFYFDTVGNLLPGKSSKVATCKALLSRDRCPPGQLSQAFNAMKQRAQDEATWVTERLNQ
jgi:hypothetical protein